MTRYEFIKREIELSATSPYPPTQIAYTRGLLAMAEMDCTVTPGESIRLMADIMDQDKACTARVLGRNAA
ncbi:hypothetical protein [Pseudomonas sp. HS-18]|uniref:hypothetical protein n=1 Tax=Pseudomonas sp. HS-18 TaxID=2879114 RepID=UPI001CEFE1AB|nr:hypothetical protein [Pseudomonas sp. HS-18]UCL89300.1 hypothetical protein LDJ84_11665 [Pseudomonas sp. HS-18]